MPVPHHARSGRRVAASTLTVLVAACGMLLAAPGGPAWAHAQLVGTDPAADAVVDHQLTSVALTFTGPVKAQFSTVLVTGADQISHSDGAPQAAERTLTQAVTPLPAGPVRVVWRTVSVDGHPVEGQFTFTNAAPGAASAAAPGAAAAGSASVAAVLQAARGGGAGWLVATAGTVLVAAALLAGWLLRRRRTAAPPPAAG